MPPQAPNAQVPLPPPPPPQAASAVFQPVAIPQPPQPVVFEAVPPQVAPPGPPPEMIDSKIFTKPFTIILLISVLLVFVAGLFFWSYIRTP